MADAESYDQSWSSMRSVVAGLAHVISVGDEAKALKGHPGKSIDIFANGRPRFVSHIRATTGSDPSEGMLKALASECDKGTALCESPIERNLLVALMTGGWQSCPERHPRVHNAKDYSEAFPRHPIVIVPQMALLRYRLDIGIVGIRRDGSPCMFGIECDGKAYHQDIQKDRDRDAYFSALGVRMMRVTGQTLNERPIAVADEIIAAIDGLLK